VAQRKQRSRTESVRRLAARVSVAFMLLFPLGAATHADVPLSHSPLPGLPPSAWRASDRTFKLDLIEKMAKPPQLIIFGGSRGTRFDPALFEQLTGLRTFNAAFSNGRPTDAWAFTSYLVQHEHVKRLHCFWALQPSSFYQKQMDVGLLTDERLARYFPETLLQEQVPKQIAYAALGLPLFWSPSEYGADGHMTWNWYDDRLAHGYTLQESLTQYIASQQSVHHGTGTGVREWGLNQLYFAQTLGLFNSMGITPVLVMMPTHPEVIAAMGQARYARKVRVFHNFLDVLRHRYRFALLDYSYIDSFGGDPSAFYDGVHVMQSNADRIVRAAVKAVPQAFQ
jgi:hypothetical protein